MKNDGIKVAPVFKTREQEELFFKCSLESMHKYMSGELSDLLCDKSDDNYSVLAAPVFKTKEQEELFFKCSLESMYHCIDQDLSVEVKKKVKKLKR